MGTVVRAANAAPPPSYKELIPEPFWEYLLQRPLTTTQWRDLSMAELFELFFVTCCLVGEGYSTGMRQLQRALDLFLTVNRCPAAVKAKRRGTWLRTMLLNYGYQPKNKDGVTLFPGLGLRMAPLDRNESWQVSPTAQRIAQRILSRTRKEAEKEHLPEWRYWQPSDVLRHFLLDNCIQSDSERTSLRELKIAAKAWRSAILKRLPYGKKSAFADDFIRDLRPRLEALGYRSVVPDNVSYVQGLALRPEVRSSLGLPATPWVHNARANSVADALAAAREQRQKQRPLMDH